ncbi:hypothetical protein Sjap_008817 [Stephania japonica]|uniref:Uncharacterized protein n=1 Tax=Stephania japonica TaxID=461633 RepID=A0AAP0JQB0_9MAGN
MIHTASLIQDDGLDDSSIRRVSATHYMQKQPFPSQYHSYQKKKSTLRIQDIGLFRVLDKAATLTEKEMTDPSKQKTWKLHQAAFFHLDWTATTPSQANL